MYNVCKPIKTADKAVFIGPHSIAVGNKSQGRLIQQTLNKEHTFPHHGHTTPKPVKGGTTMEKKNCKNEAKNNKPTDCKTADCKTKNEKN